MSPTHCFIVMLAIVHPYDIHNFSDFDKAARRTLAKLIFTHGDIAFCVNGLDNCLQALSCRNRTRISIGFFNFISKRPHDDRWIVLVFFDHHSQVKVRPFLTWFSIWMGCFLVKETAVVIGLLTVVPSIKCFFLY